MTTLTAEFRAGGVAQLLYVRGFAVPRDEQAHSMMFDNGFLSYRGYVSGSHSTEGHLTRVTGAGAQRLDFPQVHLAQASRANTTRFLDEVLDGGGGAPCHLPGPGGRGGGPGGGSGGPQRSEGRAELTPVPRWVLRRACR